MMWLKGHPSAQWIRTINAEPSVFPGRSAERERRTRMMKEKTRPDSPAEKYRPAGSGCGAPGNLDYNLHAFLPHPLEERTVNSQHLVTSGWCRQRHDGPFREVESRGRRNICIGEEREIQKRVVTKLQPRAGPRTGNNRRGQQASNYNM